MFCNDCDSTILPFEIYYEWISANEIATLCISCYSRRWVDAD